jgi:hypothetical protein
VTDPPPPSLSRQPTVADLLATADRPDRTPTVATTPAGAADRDLRPLLRRRLLIFCILGTWGSGITVLSRADDCYRGFASFFEESDHGHV